MLKLNIALRLFLVLIVISLITATGVSLATRWSFQRGFVAYLYEREENRAELIASGLGQIWKENGNWDFMQNTDVSRKTTRSILEFTADCRPGVALPNGLSLYDRQWKLVSGSENMNTGELRYPVQAHGEVVGTLVGVPRRVLANEAESRFVQHQIKSIWGIVLAVVALAALAAVALARNFLAPIKHIIESTTRLAGGNYAVHVPENRQDELGRLAKNFNAMANKLNSSEIARRQFMADVSHELRSPLAIMCAELEAMEDGVRPLTLETIRSLHCEANNLTRLIDDIRQLSFAEVKALQYNWQTLSLATLLEDHQHSWRDLLTKAGIVMEIQSSVGLVIHGDPGRLLQLLRNLIENVRQHANGASLLRIILRRERDHAIIECHDNGKGVAEDSLSRLFERFWREDSSRARSTGGSGLGLAICRSIVIAHGGHIEAEQSFLGGLCVRTYFPLIESKP